MSPLRGVSLHDVALGVVIGLLVVALVAVAVG